MELWTAFVFGFLGSLHCLGMCGPIALALPVASQSRFSFISSRLLYNLGRITTYGAIGALAGAFGQSLHFAGYQKSLSIFLGLFVLIAILLPAGWLTNRLPFIKNSKLIKSMKLFWADLFTDGSRESLFVIGLLNGFLPCGFVYLALAGAVTTGSVLDGIFYMALFGAGTAPVMFAISLVGRLINLRIRKKMTRVLPVGGVLLAVLIIMRGMSLGIPFVSPKIADASPNSQVQVEPCHTIGFDSTVIDTNFID